MDWRSGICAPSRLEARKLDKTLEGVRSMKPSLAKKSLAVGNQPDHKIKDRETNELVFGLVGPVGAGVTSTAAVLEDVLVRAFGYTVNRFKISEIIEESRHLVGDTTELPTTHDDQRIRHLQKVGSELRELFDKAILAEKAVERIAVYRQSNGGYESTGEYAEPKRWAHIIDSLKNPAEVELLRAVYGDNFWVIGVFAPDSVRIERLKRQRLDAKKIHEIIAIDQDEGPKHGQLVQDTIHLADFFIRNDAENDKRLRENVNRYLSLLFGISVFTPTPDETAMYAAASAATSSACLSRQVGASIYTETGELIGIGCNDVPKFGGGLYSVDDGKSDHRCFLWGGKICHNDAEKEQIYSEIYEALAPFTNGTQKATIVSSLKQTRVRDLIEFSRAVHAEMDAIVSVARANKPGLVGATLYCTTFPCHSCARHIVAAGIKRVVYIEPYTKSLALHLHSDAIATSESASSKVVFLQYEGVAPKNMIRLFKMRSDERKKDGKAVTREPQTAALVFPSPLDGFSTREKLVVHKLRNIEEQHGGQQKSPGL